MKPHPRIRKTIKWGGAAVTVLLVVAWVGSGWLACGWQARDGRAIFATAGAIGWVVYGQPDSDGVTTTMVRSRSSWFLTSTSQAPWSFSRPAPGAVTHGGIVRLLLPLWPLVVGASLVTAIAWRLDALARRRARGGLNLCPNCNYDRAGIAADALCPECGAPAANRPPSGPPSV
jgi:hypothetical protein